jgi:crotonobetainyl-CoA:carnitine CoA-transferase CaiB-like acyl-CoA transferase
VTHRTELVPLLRQTTVHKTTAEWIAALEQANVPCGPINTLEQVFADPHVQARGLHVNLAHSVTDSVPSVASPLRFSKTPVQYLRAPPALGADTEQVLSALSVSTNSHINPTT